MGRNLEKDAVEMVAKNQRILENGLRVFAENGIENVTMNDVAKTADIAVSSLYRYYSSKPKLVMAIGTWAWAEYVDENEKREAALERPDRTAAEMFEFYLESFLDLYRDHKDLLRFNQFLNIYLASGEISCEEIQPYLDMIHRLEKRFGRLYRKALEDGTLRTEMPEKEMFSATLHLMMAVITRYAVGLAYNGEMAAGELRMQKEMLMKRFIREG
jgi:AcrR family transcriptional regulator